MLNQKKTSLYVKENGVLRKITESSLQTNPNLLDNPDFKINQRCASSSDNGRFGVDRWAGKYTIDESGINIDVNAYITQTFEKGWFEQFNSRWMTLQISIDGVVYYGKSYITTYPDGHYDTDNFIRYPFHVDIYSPNGAQTTNPCIRFFGVTSAHHIEWVKLELGEIPTQYIPPNPSIELLKCQRYFQTIGTGARIQLCYTGDNPSLKLSQPLATHMRVIPSLSIATLKPRIAARQMHILTQNDISINTFNIKKDGIGWIWFNHDAICEHGGGIYTDTGDVMSFADTGHVFELSADI